jgi:hypothetical protein
LLPQLLFVPNIGAKNNSYMWLRPRHTWRDLFVRWLHEPYHMDDLSDSEADLTASEADDVQDDISVASSDPEEEEEGTDSESEEDSIAELDVEIDGN